MNKPSNFPWSWLLVAVILLTIWLTGVKELVFNYLYPPNQQVTQSTPTPAYEPAPPDPTKNSPGGDYFNYIKTAVPTEYRERVSLPQLFSLDTVLLNQYFDQSTYIQANTEVVIVSAQRARAAEMYSAVVWKDTWWTQTLGINGQVLNGSELATITSADMFLVVGTTPGAVLANIINVKVDGQTVTVTAEVEITALYLGLNVSEETSNPQVESMAIATPDPILDAWLLYSDKLPSESELNNRGIKTATKEAVWLLLHKDGDRLWQEYKQSIEASNGGTSGYDMLAPFVKKAFCSKLGSYQKQLEAEGKLLDLQSCDTNVTIDVVLIPKLPQGPYGQESIEFMKMAHTGAYVQIPDPSYSVEP